MNILSSFNPFQFWDEFHKSYDMQEPSLLLFDAYIYVCMHDILFLFFRCKLLKNGFSHLDSTVYNLLHN